MLLVFEVFLIVGFLAVASNPSPFYAALSLVVSSGLACLLLMDGGVPLVSLVLFLVYLGGMLVVFGYSVALSAEPYPNAWGSMEVLFHAVAYVILLLLWWVNSSTSKSVVFEVGLDAYVPDWFGLSVVFSLGGGILFFLGWALLLNLFAVLEVVRGHYSGVLRAL